MTVDKVRVFDYLNALRDSGIVNMFGSVPYVRRVFDVSQADGVKLVVEWMESFKEGK
jgi:hypothetical protein